MCQTGSDWKAINGCMAFSLSEDNLPSIAMGMNNQMQACMLESAAAPTVGMSSLLAAAVKTTMDYTAFGFSLTNAFESPKVVFYNGQSDLQQVTLTPTVFEYLKLKIDPASFSSSLKDFFALTGEFMSGYSIYAPNDNSPPPTQEDIEGALNNYTATANTTDGTISDTSSVLAQDWTVQQFMTGQVKGKFTFSKIPYIRALIQDTDSFELAQTSIITTTGQLQIDGQTIYPGLSFFAGVGVTDFLVKMATDVIEGVGAILVS
jgi:hypothetical protein